MLVFEVEWSEHCSSCLGASGKVVELATGDTMVQGSSGCEWSEIGLPMSANRDGGRGNRVQIMIKVVGGR